MRTQTRQEALNEGIRWECFLRERTGIDCSGNYRHLKDGNYHPAVGIQLEALLVVLECRSDGKWRFYALADGVDLCDSDFAWEGPIDCMRAAFNEIMTRTSTFVTRLNSDLVTIGGALIGFREEDRLGIQDPTG